MGYQAGKFSQESYDDNDEFAKEKFRKFIINKKGHKIISDKEDYNHDVVTEKNNKTYYFELEIKRNYPFKDKDSFRFPSVSFLARKQRLHALEPFHYIIICYETGYAVGCDSKKIFKDDYYEELDLNAYNRKGNDGFYRVPKDECYFFKL